MATHAAPDILDVLREFHRERLALRQRHVAVARHVGDYNFNNTYQYVINREDVHLQWLETAIVELGGTPENVGEPSVPAPGKKGSFVPLVQQDAADAGAFVAKWRPRIDALPPSQARHRSMMQVILGETLEQKRSFDQIAAGNDDVLGRRMAGAGTGNGVMAERWRGSD